MRIVNISFSTRQKGITKFYGLAAPLVLIPAGSGVACFSGACPGELLISPTTPNNTASWFRKFKYQQRAS